jgi:hypothetical protein
MVTWNIIFADHWTTDLFDKVSDDKKTEDSALSSRQPTTMCMQCLTDNLRNDNTRRQLVEALEGWIQNSL